MQKHLVRQLNSLLRRHGECKEVQSLQDSLNRTIALKLHEIGAIKFGDFTLTSGKWSPIYIDLRIVPSFPDVFDIMTDCYVELLKDKKNEIRRIVGVPTAGLPIATLVSYKMRLPLLYVRKEKREHGTRKSIEGILNKEDIVAIVDDLATTGGSVKEAAIKVRDAGGIVKYAVVLIDRLQGAKKNLKEEGIELLAYATINDILDILVKERKISIEQHKKVLDYIKNQ